MVIIIPKTQGTEDCARCVLGGMFKLYILIFLFLGPIFFAWGIDDLLFSTNTVEESLGMVGGGLCIIGFAVIFLYLQERKKRKKWEKNLDPNAVFFLHLQEKRKRKTGDRYLDEFRLGFICLVGLVEIIVGLAQAYDGAHGSIRVTLIGGGGITLLPAAIWLIIMIVKDNRAKSSGRKTSAPLAPPKVPPTQTTTEIKTYDYTETTFSTPVETKIDKDESAEDFFSSLDKKSEEE